MKKTYIFILAAVAMVALLLLSGCIDVTNEDGTGPTEYWDGAYDFENTVNTTAGAQGKLDTFTYKENIIEGEENHAYEIKGKYEGLKNTTIHGFEYDYETGNSTKAVAGYIDCYVIHYNISRTSSTSEEAFPDWYSVRIFRVYDASNDADYYSSLGYWAKYESWDSDGNYYVWENPDAVEFNSELTVYYEGEDNDEAYDGVVWHLYYSLWGGFWVNYGEGFRDGKEWGITIAGVVGWSHSTDKITQDVGSHTFDAWEAKSKWNADESSYVNKAIISTSCPIPLLFQWKTDDSGDINSFQYELTSVTFK